MANIAEVQEVSRTKLKPYERNAKIHSAEQVTKIANSIREFGFLSPCLIDRDFNIIAGHGRVLAAEELGLDTVPCVFIEGLTEEQRRAYILADNRLTELGDWDEDLLQIELGELAEEGFDVDVAGFDLPDYEEEEEKEEPENPTDILPESRIMGFFVSAFGTDSETFLEVQLSGEEANLVIQKTREESAETVINAIREALNGL